MEHQYPGWLQLWGRQFWILTKWELRHLYGRRSRAWGVVWLAAGLAVGSTAWWAGGHPEEADRFFAAPGDPAMLSPAVAWLMAAPIRDETPDIRQMSFGYAWFGFTAFLVAALARLILPAVAAGSVANDRRSGRLAELELTLLTAREIYLAKALAAALPWLMLFGALLIVFGGVLLAEFVPASEVSRVSLQLADQVLLTAFVTVTCSALFRSRWPATILAYLLLGIVLPVGWVLLLLVWTGLLPAYVSTTSDSLGNSLSIFYTLAYRPDHPPALAAQSAFQVAVTVLLCAAATGIGVRKLRPDGSERAIRRRFPMWGRRGAARSGRAKR